MSFKVHAVVQLVLVALTNLMFSFLYVTFIVRGTPRMDRVLKTVSNQKLLFEARTKSINQD